jgi:hypothetical protein
LEIFLQIQKLKEVWVKFDLFFGRHGGWWIFGRDLSLGVGAKEVDGGFGED